MSARPAWTPAEQPRAVGDERRTNAVIDIGSNSVRLVIYDGPARAQFPICNEKALCGLGRSLTDDGALNPAAREAALTTLGRFRHILRDFGDPPVFAVATAAVREASDGPGFVREAEALGFRITIITGEREAELAALGVIAFEPSARGLVGDMGGGSLELIHIDGQGASDRASLSIGPLRLLAQHGDDRKAAQKQVNAALDGVDWLPAHGAETFYMVGGAWRAIAKIRMHQREHPLTVLHHFDMSVRETIEVCSFIAGQSAADLAELPGASRRRLEVLPYAALVLKSILERTEPSGVFVSAAGLREGLLFENLSAAAKGHHPLIAGARFFARRLAPAPAVGEAVWDMIAPLFVGAGRALSEERAHIGRAAALMIDIGAFFHPDLRALHAFDTALRAPLQGLDHADRVWIALALYGRHDGSKSRPDAPAVLDLLSDAARADAERFGLALRFAGAFAPKSSSALAGCRLSINGDMVRFSAPSERAPLMQELARRRLDALAAAFDRAADIRFG